MDKDNANEEALTEMEESEEELSVNYYKERESWLDFNYRIINESKRSVNPIFERINFLCISDSNLDEFLRTKYKENSGLKKLVTAQASAIEESYSKIEEELRTIGIDIRSIEYIISIDSEGSYISELRNIFYKEIYPLIQPMILRDELPIPEIEDDGYFAVSKIESDDVAKEFSGIIKLPKTKLIEVKPKKKDRYFVRSDDLTLYFINVFYRGKKILWTKPFRVFRKIESLAIADEENNYLKAIKNGLDNRKKAEVVLVDISTNIDGLESILDGVKKRKRVHPCGFGFLSDVKDYVDDKDGLVYKKAKPRMPVEMAGMNIFNILSEQDILVHFPYESFEYSTIRFLQQAAEDPDVMVIKQSLYRVSENSPIIQALCTAAKAGKQVVVLLELKAKMDEYHNLKLVDILSKAGCNIVYGPIQIKTHAKVTLVVRNESGVLKKYVNISTGNFNDKTAKIYEDFSYFCKETKRFPIGNDLLDLFNMLGGCSNISDTNELLISPFNFRKQIEEEINKCIQDKKTNPDHKVRIIMKCNSFTDKQMADKLYEASQAGVDILLIIRGMCIVKAGIPELSENIRIKSVVGRFLEHSRVYEFMYHDDANKYNLDENGMAIHQYIGSGDMMPRNLDYRVEVITPIKSRSLSTELYNEIHRYELDTFGSYIMQPDGIYSLPDDNGYSVQNELISIYKDAEKSLLK